MLPMVYCVLCEMGEEDLVLDSFVSKGAAEQYVQKAQKWFALPLIIRKMMNIQSVIIEKSAS